MQNLPVQTAKAEVLEKRATNLDKRTREYLLPHEVEALIGAAKLSKHGHRDSTLILLSYRHGLRVNEALALTWADVDFIDGSLHINRLKKGLSGRHPLRRIELIALHKLKKVQSFQLPYIFISQQGKPLGARCVRIMMTKAAIAAKLQLTIHPHMMRHSCGYYLASKGMDTRAIAEYLGHKSLDNVWRYTAIAPGRFNDFWRD